MQFPTSQPQIKVDMYVHESVTGTLTLIRRYSSEPSAYGSWSTRGVPMISKYQRVLDAWNKMRKTESL